MEDQEWVDAFTASLNDDETQQARETFCRAAAAAFRNIGTWLDNDARVRGNNDSAGVSVAARIGASLASGACDLLDTGNTYAAAALLRQVVEVEYLLWTFADDAGDAGRWMKASRSQLDKHYRPAAMRKRSNGKFRSSEYHTHCDFGGHPTPRGWTLLDNPRGIDQARVQWHDLAQHLLRAWGELGRACTAIGKPISERDGDEVARTGVRWHELDEALRIGPPPGMPLGGDQRP